MSFTFVNSSSVTGGGGSGVSSVSLPVPTGVQSGDVLLFAVQSYTGTTTWPSGVNSLATGSGQSGTDNWAAAYKIATASESAYTLTFSAAIWCAAMCYAIRGGANAAPTFYSTTNTSATFPTNLPAASGTLGSSNDATVYVYSGGASGNSGAPTLTFPGGLSNTAQVTNSSAGQVVGFGWGVDLTAPGSATASIALDYGDMLFDVAPNAIAYTVNPADSLGLTDRLPPVPPDGLTATAVSPSEIDLSWYMAAGADAYDIERGGTTIVTAQTGHTYADTGLAASTTYSYNVRARFRETGTGK